jgi:L-fucose isomerase-like protein
VKRLIHILFLLCLMFATASAQFGDHRPSPSPEEVKRQKELQKSLNKQRVKEIKEDTDKLLDLANELKKSVDAAADNTLSLEVIRKTDEIEKLAKKVRGKMKETYELPDSTRMPDATSR